MKHIFGALCKFLNLNNDRIKDLTTQQENGKKKLLFFSWKQLDVIIFLFKGQTTVSFSLFELLKEVPNSQTLSELRSIIDTEKFIIIDYIINKTCVAIQGSLKYGKII